MMALMSLGLDAEVLWRHYLRHVQALDDLLEGADGSLMVRRRFLLTPFLSKFDFK
jgi:hypothetical protein